MMNLLVSLLFGLVLDVLNKHGTTKLAGTSILITLGKDLVRKFLFSKYKNEKILISESYSFSEKLIIKI